jgi:eukaryotic-like serine/threonine-protein kinase
MQDTQGTTLILDGRYELSKELGRGATGTVWEAFDRVAARTVAVKLFEPSLLRSRAARKRFLREAATASRLCHPHTVEVLCHGETPEGGAYLVMERIQGETLADRLRSQGPLPQRRAIKIIVQVLDAVVAAHELGIVHRDVKPSNVLLVEQDGDPDFVKVCDFGLAKAIDPEFADSSKDPDVAVAIDLTSPTTEQGQLCGTPEYMAPEQARGERLDVRADLYAVAATLFHMIVGRPPFVGRTPLAVVSLHLSAPPPRPSELRPELAIFTPLENLILRALAKDRTERPSSAQVFRSDLLQIDRDYARWVDKGSAASGYASAASETLRSAPATLRKRAGSAALLMTSVAAAILSLALWSNGKSSPNPTPSARQAVRPAEAPNPSPPARTEAPRAAAAPAPAEAPTLLSALSEQGRAAPAEPSRLAAKPDLARPAKLVPARPKPLLVQAQEALARGRVVEACALGQTAAAAAPDSAATWKFLGQCSMRLGDRERGVTYYRRYLELAPESSDAVFIREMIR